MRQDEEDIAQIRRRVIETNNALRNSGQAWEPACGSDEEPAVKDEDENDYEDDEDDEEAIPPSPIAADNMHVWILQTEHGGPYRDVESTVMGLYRHFNHALQAAFTELREHEHGEDEDSETYFAGPKGLLDIAEGSTDIYTWRFEDLEGGYMSVDIQRMSIR